MSEMKGFLDITFSKAGHIDGNPITKKVGSIDTSKMLEVSWVDHKVTAPIDGHTGQHRGRRTHSPMLVICEVENAGYPLLFGAICSNDTFTKAVLHFPRTNAKGENEMHTTITLEKGGLTELSTQLANVLEAGGGRSSDPTRAAMPMTVKFGLSYQKITIENIFKKNASDDWETRA
jgi:type VI secretion system Hcp family effector